MHGGILQNIKARKYFKAAEKRKALGKYDPETETLYLQAVAAGTAKYWNDYLKYVTHTRSHCPELLKKYDYAISLQKKPCAELLARYALVLNEFNYIDLATEYHRQATKLNKNIFRNYLGINAIAPNNKASLYDSIMKCRNDFANLLNDNKESFCIVGNSPDELMSGNGYKIDKHNLVIRFNNYSSDGSFGKDYGAKTDIWVRSSQGSDVHDRDISDYKLIMFSGGNFIHSNRRWDLVEKYINSKPVGFFPDSCWHDLIKQLQAPPSAGLLTIYSIFKLIGPIPREKIYGISLHAPQKSDPAHYFDSAKPGIRHNWVKEKEILAGLIK